MGKLREGKDVSDVWSASSPTISPALLGQLHQHLSQILALEQLQKRCWRILDAMLDGFLLRARPKAACLAYPGGQLWLGAGRNV